MVTQDQVSIRDVAQLAGVALGTVSNVLNRPEKVAEPPGSGSWRPSTSSASSETTRPDSSRRARAARSASSCWMCATRSSPTWRKARSSRRPSKACRCCSPTVTTRRSGNRYLDLFEQQRVQGSWCPRSATSGPGWTGSIGTASGRPGRPEGRRAALLLGRGGRRRRWLPGRLPPDRSRLPAHRLRRRAAQHSPGRRSPARRQPGGRGTRCVQLELMLRDGLTVHQGRAAGRALVKRPPAETPRRRLLRQRSTGGGGPAVLHHDGALEIPGDIGWWDTTTSTSRAPRSWPRSPRSGSRPS